MINISIFKYNFERILQPFLTLWLQNGVFITNSAVSLVNFKQENTSWDLGNEGMKNMA